MKTFQEFTNEMALDRGVHDKSTFSKKSEWEKFFKGTDKAKLERKDIGSNHLKLYRVGVGSFILTDNNDAYKGQIELSISNHIATIKSSHSDLTSGFYNIIFTTLLSLPDISEIHSDHLLSTNAIDAYKRLTVNSSLKIKVYSPNLHKYYIFSKEELLKSANNVVSITETHSLKEHFEDYYSRIYECGSAHNLEFINCGSGVDYFLFCEDCTSSTS